MTRRQLEVFGVGFVLAVVIGYAMPAWLAVTAGAVVAVAGSLVLTRPADVSLGRHVGAYLGRIVLDVAASALRAVAGVLAVLGVIVVLWSGVIAPRLSSVADHAVSTTTSAATSWLPGWLR